MSSWHKYGGIGHDSKFKNLMSNNLASNEIAKMNKLYANNICVAHDVDVSGNVYVDGSVDISGNLDLCGNAVIDGTLDVSGHSQLCDVSACNVDISGNLRVDASVNFTTGVIDVPRYVNTTGLTGNVFIGDESGLNITNASATNTCVGNRTLRQIPTGSVTFNAAFGNAALENTTEANENSSFGAGASQYLQTGNNNLSLGTNAGRALSNNAGFVSSFSNSCYIGSNTHPSAVTGIQNETVIGYDAKGKGSNTVQIGNCDVSDVYLGCDGSGTTLHVDNILLCDLSACNVDISQNLRVDGSVNFTNARKIFMDQGNIILDEQGQIGLGFDALSQPRDGATNNIAIGREALKDCSGNNCIDNVAIGSSALKHARENTSQNVVIGFNAGHEITGHSSDNVLIGRDCGSHHFDSSFIDMSGCVGIGMRAVWDVSGNVNCISIGSQKNVDNTLTYGSTNEIVIGCDASGMGTDTVQIGNCDTSAVYLGCLDGDISTNLFVDNVEASSITVSGENIYNALFGGSEMAFKKIQSTGDASGTIGVIPASIAVNHGVIFLEPNGGPTGTYEYQLESGTAVEDARNTFESIESTLFLKFSLINSAENRNITLRFNHFDPSSNSAGEAVTARGVPGDGGNIPSIIRWNGNATVADSKSMVGGLELSWNEDSWSVINGFNFTEIKNAEDNVTLISG